MAKRIIKLVTAVGVKINNDPSIGDLLKVVFVPDYNVSLAEILIPGECTELVMTTQKEVCSRIRIPRCGTCQSNSYFWFDFFIASNTMRAGFAWQVGKNTKGPCRRLRL